MYLRFQKQVSTSGLARVRQDYGSWALTHLLLSTLTLSSQGSQTVTEY